MERGLKLDKDYHRIPEPVSPGAAKRMSRDEKMLLQAQHQLDAALADMEAGSENGCVIAAQQALVTLGWFDEAAELGADEALELKEACECDDNERCECKPTNMIVVHPQSTKTMREVSLSPYQETRRVFSPPHGRVVSLWCCPCGHKNAFDGFPDERAATLAGARANFPTKNAGSDYEVLSDACKGC